MVFDTLKKIIKKIKQMKKEVWGGGGAGGEEVLLNILPMGARKQS